jgi:hypothetical protein
MSEINAETVRSAINNADPVLEALSVVLKEVTAGAAEALVEVLGMLGHDAHQMPGEFLMQSMLVESEKTFQPISRENWIKIYDSYTEIKAIIDGNPDLQGEIVKHKESQTERLTSAAASTEPVHHVVGGELKIDKLLNGDF